MSHSVKLQNDVLFENPMFRGWLDELRSTDADQAADRLCKVNVDTGAVVGFCCLGIAEEQSYRSGLVSKSVDGDSVRYFSDKGDSATSLTPATLISWGVPEYSDGQRLFTGNVSVIADLNGNGTVERTDVASLNDSQKGWTFYKIANAIEATAALGERVLEVRYH